MTKQNPEAIEALLMRADWARGLARRLVRDEALADDVVQTAYLAAMENPPRQEARRDAWLRRVIRNVASVTRRGDSRRRRREIGRSPVETAAPAAVDQVTRMEMHRRLADAVLRLDDPYRDVVVQRYYEGRTSEAIAAAAGVPSATIRNRLKRAIDRLRHDLDATSESRGAWMASVAAIAFAEAGGAGAATESALSSEPGMSSSSGGSWLGLSPTGMRIAGSILIVSAAALVVWQMRSGSDASTREPEDARSVAMVSEDAEGAAPEPRLQPPRDATPVEGSVDARTERSVSAIAASPPAVESSAPPSLVVYARRADGSPAPGCRIRIDKLTTSALDPMRELRHQGAVRVVASDDGVAVVERMEEGRWLVGTWDHVATEVVPEGDGKWTAIDDVPFSIEDRDATHEVTVTVARGATIRGRIVDDSGRPLEGAWISIRRGGTDPLIDGAFKSATGSFPTDANGEFVFFEGLVRDEPYGLVVRHRNCDDDIRMALELEAGESVDVGTLALTNTPRGSVHGEIEALVSTHIRLIVIPSSDPDREPVAEWTHWPEANETKAFYLHGLDQGAYEVQIAERRDIEPVRVRITRPGERYDVGKIRIPARDCPHRLFGRVVDVDGIELAGATVSAAGESTETDADGFFELGAPSVGPHRVTISSGDRVNRLTARFEGVSFDGSSRTFELRPRGLRFDFVDGATGEPVNWTRLGFHCFRLEQGERDLTYTRWDLAYLEEIPRVSSLRDVDVHRMVGTGRFGMLFYVDGYEAAEVEVEITDDLAESEQRVVVPLERL